jgi:hypothetical protein
VPNPVTPASDRIDIDNVVPNHDLIGLDIVRELVEGSAALQVEPSVVPMAGQDSVADTPAVQRKPHVRAAIVHGVNRVGSSRSEDSDAVTTA